jgi:dienelactone hydrolase
MRISGAPAFALVVLVFAAGCANTPAGDTYRVDSDGNLVITLVQESAWEGTVLNRTDNITLSRVVFSNGGTPVTSYVAAPPHPRAGIVYIPGANEPVTGHAERFREYATAGFAFLYLDVRGDGFETPGDRFDLASEYRLFRNREWPQYYRVVADAMRARVHLEREYGISSVWIVGSSNGGRYAAIAAATDPSFSGYVGISTSGFSIGGGDADLRRFTSSIDPAARIGSISPRAVLIYHSESDPIIPFGDGRALYEAAKEPKTFVTFAGSHGIDPMSDRDLIGRLTQIYGS